MPLMVIQHMSPKQEINYQEKEKKIGIGREVQVRRVDILTQLISRLLVITRNTGEVVRSVTSIRRGEYSCVRVTLNNSKIQTVFDF